MKTLKSSDAGLAGSVRRKTDFLPTVFVSVEFDNAFVSLVTGCFKAMIVAAHNGGDRTWNDLLCQLDRHGLFDLTVPNEIVLAPMEFHFKDAGGKSTTRVYEPTEPLSYGFERLRLEIDRSLLLNERHLEETSAILAYLFAWKLFVLPFQAHHFALVRVDAELLSSYLRLHHRGEVSPDSLSRFIIARTIDDLVKDLPVLVSFDRAVLSTG